MTEVFVFFVLVGAVVVPLALWLILDSETSNPTIVDRAEAERLAKERGGRGVTGSNAAESDTDDPDGDGADREWGTRRNESDRDRDRGRDWDRDDRWR